MIVIDLFCTCFAYKRNYSLKRHAMFKGRIVVAPLEKTRRFPEPKVNKRFWERATRVASASIERIEDELAAGKMKGTQLVPVFGVSVDKLAALSNDAMQVQVQVQHTHDLGSQLHERLNRLHAALTRPASPAQSALANGETLSDSGR
jgi:hypothetical protein